jgi:hypothetical protein
MGLYPHTPHHKAAVLHMLSAHWTLLLFMLLLQQPMLLLLQQPNHMQLSLCQQQSRIHLCWGSPPRARA